MDVCNFLLTGMGFGTPPPPPMPNFLGNVAAPRRLGPPMPDLVNLEPHGNFGTHART